MALDVDVIEVITTQVIVAESTTSSVVEVTPQPDLIEVSTVETVIVDIQAPQVTEVVVGIPGPAGPPGGEEMPMVQKEVDFVGQDMIYRGEAAPGSLTSDPVWRIKRILFVGEDISEKWAGGSALFDKVWNDRATYSY